METPLAALLEDARRRTLAVASSLAPDELLGPRLAIVNPPLWELGHVAWFEEKWCLRRGGAAPCLEGADRLYDSAAIAHDTRWDLPLPPLDRTLEYLAEVSDRVRDRVRAGSADAYFVELAAHHESMHFEAMAFTRQTLARAAPRVAGLELAAPVLGGLEGDVEVPGGPVSVGARPGAGFVFDNEKWAHEVLLRPFSIARAPVTQARFAEFVDDGGYRRDGLWSDEGWRWRVAAGAEAPAYWSRREGRWARRDFDAWVPLEPDRPMVNVSWFEAEAWCRWAGRRLPGEEEWEAAVAGRHLADRALRRVWEWTASPFLPYPGFEPDPYREYSQPWFGTHRVLRGGSFATPPSLLRTTFRNFYTPDRRDPWAGFRTCAP